MSGLEQAVEELGTICAELRGKLVRVEQSNIDLQCRLQGLTEEREAFLQEAEARKLQRELQQRQIERLTAECGWFCEERNAAEASLEKANAEVARLNRRIRGCEICDGLADAKSYITSLQTELAAANAKAAELCAGYNNRTHELEKRDGQLEAAEQHIKILKSQIQADARELEARRALDKRQADGSVKFSTSGMALIADEDLLLIPITRGFGAAYIRLAENLDLLKPEPVTHANNCSVCADKEDRAASVRIP